MDGTRPHAIGWRVAITAKRGGGMKRAQVKVCGHWLSLHDESVLKPIGQDDKVAVSDAPGTADEVSVRNGGELALSRFALLSVNPHASNEPN